MLVEEDGFEGLPVLYFSAVEVIVLGFELGCESSE
jgi:hypothetical protein